MRTMLLTTIIVSCTSTYAAATTTSLDDEEDARDLSVLYAGFPGGEREKHFVEFLEQWFPDVETIDLQELNAKAAEGFDVVVADWKPHYDNGNYIEGSDPSMHLGADYSRPTITVGTVGTVACGGKLDWL